MPSDNDDKRLLDQQLLDQRIIEQQLIAALTSQQSRAEAWELLGLSAERYQRIAELADERVKLPGALTTLGLDCCYQQREGSRELALGRPLTISTNRAALTRRVAEILWPLIPEQRRLLVIFSQAPESAIFNLLPDEQQLTLFLDPRGQERQERPGPEWEEISGGWRRGHFLAPRRGYFISAERSGGYRFSAANRQRVSAELQELLAAADWPDRPNQQEQLLAQRAWNKITAIDELIADHEDYRRQRRWELQELERESLDLAEQVDDQQREIEDLRQDLAQAEELLLARQREHSATQERRASISANQELDERQAIANGWRLLVEVEQINQLPEVAQAEVYNLFDSNAAGGPELFVDLLTTTADQEAVSFNISEGAVLFSDGQQRREFQSRQLAWAEKFASGQWLSLVKMIIKALEK